jgi:hypothetical protein
VLFSPTDSIARQQAISTRVASRGIGHPKSEGIRKSRNGWLIGGRCVCQAQQECPRWTSFSQCSRCYFEDY